MRTAKDVTLFANVNQYNAISSAARIVCDYPEVFRQDSHVVRFIKALRERQGHEVTDPDVFSAVAEAAKTAGAPRLAVCVMCGGGGAGRGGAAVRPPGRLPRVLVRGCQGGRQDVPRVRGEGDGGGGRDPLLQQKVPPCAGESRVNAHCAGPWCKMCHWEHNRTPVLICHI